METRGAFSDGFGEHCIFDALWYYYERGRFLRRAFFDTTLPIGVVVGNVKGIEIAIFIGIGTSSQTYSMNRSVIPHLANQFLAHCV